MDPRNTHPLLAQLDGVDFALLAMIPDDKKPMELVAHHGMPDAFMLKAWPRMRDDEVLLALLDRKPGTFIQLDQRLLAGLDLSDVDVRQASMMLLPRIEGDSILLVAAAFNHRLEVLPMRHIERQFRAWVRSQEARQVHLWSDKLMALTAIQRATLLMYGKGLNYDEIALIRSASGPKPVTPATIRKTLQIISDRLQCDTAELEVMGRILSYVESS